MQGMFSRCMFHSFCRAVVQCRRHSLPKEFCRLASRSSTLMVEEEESDHNKISTVMNNNEEAEAFQRMDAFDSSLEMDENLDKLAANIIESLKLMDKDGSLMGKDVVKDPLNEPDISQMETGEETASRPINRFREIIYDSGELDHSDLTKPPSRDNPHPLDVSQLPPTHARTMAAYVNHLPVLQRLLDLGMDLFEVEVHTNVGRHLIRKDWETDLKPKIYWLVKEVGVSTKDVGSYLTRNPYFLLQDLNEMKKRVKYLYSKKIDKQAVAKMVVEWRYWLNMDVKIIDARLGWLQRQFRLRGDGVRQLIVKEPRLIMFGVGPLQAMTNALNRELGFSPGQVKSMMMNDPRLFLCDIKQVTSVYHYLTKVMQLSVAQLAAYPLALRCQLSSLRARHEFLQRLDAAQYNKDLPDHVTLAQLLHPSDKFFAETVARSYAEDYNKFLKLL